MTCARMQKFGMKISLHRPTAFTSSSSSSSAQAKSDAAAAASSSSSTHTMTADAEQSAASSGSDTAASSSVALAMPRASRNSRVPSLTPPNIVHVCLVCDRFGRPVLSFPNGAGAVAAQPAQVQSECPVAQAGADSEAEDSVELVGLACGHRFCVDCWNAHMSTAVREARSLLGTPVHIFYYNIEFESNSLTFITLYMHTCKLHLLTPPLVLSLTFSFTDTHTHTQH